MSSSPLDQLLASNPHLWRGGRYQKTEQATISSGFSELDRRLPGKGWPTTGLIEIITPCWGIGELHLLMSLMRQLQTQAKQIAWLNPPYQPYAPALQQAGLMLDHHWQIDTGKLDADLFWSLEQCLCSGLFGLVMAWPVSAKFAHLRRLQLAAEENHSLALLFYPKPLGNTPATLRLQLFSKNGQRGFRLLKARGQTRQDDCGYQLFR